MQVRIDRHLATERSGDVKLAGHGVSELRIDYRPGFRVYNPSGWPQTDPAAFGGNKATTDNDILAAKRIAQQWKPVLRFRLIQARSTLTRGYQPALGAARSE